MKRFIGILLKVLPLITLWQGLTSGGARLEPFLQTIKVALTQYEVAQIARLVVDELNRSNGKLIPPEKFPEFIRDNFHSQYSVLAREIKGDKSHDHSRDIWGTSYQLIHNRMASSLKIASAGPDLKISTKDDVGVDFPFEDPTMRRPASTPKKQIVREEIIIEEDPGMEQDEYSYEEGREPSSEASDLTYPEQQYDVQDTRDMDDPYPGE